MLTAAERDVLRKKASEKFRAHEWQGRPSLGWQCKHCEAFAINPPFTMAHLPLLDGFCGRSLHFEHDPLYKRAVTSKAAAAWDLDKEIKV